MVKKILFAFISHSKRNSISSINKLAGFNASRNINTRKVPVREVNIPTRWNGHIAAKLWGDDQERPILALHGWQDNAGTWDPLALTLCTKFPILAIDLPGHGFSSWIPKGMIYYPWDITSLILYIKEYFKWDKVSLLGHSMGSVAAQRYASIFPDAVDFYIAIENLTYELDRNLNVDRYANMILKTEEAQDQLDIPAPCYTFDEAAGRWYRGSYGSLTKESVAYLMKRGVKESVTEPNKFFISRDPRWKNVIFSPEDKKLTKVLVSRLKCPTLYIKGKDSPYASDDYATEIRETIASCNPNFEHHILPGTHHLHLNNPEIITPLVMDFWLKHKFI